MSWVQYIPMAISAASSILNYSSGNKQNSYAQSINQYNALRSYHTNLKNLKLQAAVGAMNANAAVAIAGMQSQMAMQDAMVNAGIIRATTVYNDSLLETEIDEIWEAAELDKHLLTLERERERGVIEADQAASGTVMGTGSNAEVIIGQKTQEALEKAVLTHRANLAVRDIQNTRAKNMWEGEMQARKVEWEGALGGLSARLNGASQAISIMGSTALNTMAGIYSAENELTARWQNADVQYNQNKTTLHNNFISGMFQSGAAAISEYYDSLAV